MKEYTKYLRGSEWRRWDLHIHTPETKKEDRFKGKTLEEKWDKYVRAINNSEAEVAVVGITDYTSIDNYFKFKKLYEGGDITKSFDLIIPNIELRVLPTTGSAKAVNLHCLFNPEIDLDIEGRFLSKISIKYSKSKFSATNTELVRLGKKIENNMTLDKKSAKKIGIEQFVISLDTLRRVFEEDPDLRDNTIIIVSNKSTDGVSGLVNHADFFTKTGSQLDTTRHSIYQLADAIFSSNQGDCKYFLGKKSDSKETIIQKCGSLKPCFHGSDAHSNEELFNPDEKRYCWIKADPIFEGLKQALYEPEDRVKIQSFRPDVKNDRHVISEIQFLNEGNLFGKQKILLNDNLNAIIGGKSSGKSLLIYSTAKSIDPEQVQKTSKRLDFEGYKFKTSYDFQVTWKNGEKDILKSVGDKNHKITYIPQLYINYLVEKNNKEDLNTLIENILLQDSDFKSIYESTFESISEINLELDRLLAISVAIVPLISGMLCQSFRRSLCHFR